jgi:phosphoribosylglycinamide formyltransferase 1
VLHIGWFTTARGPGSRSMFEAVSEAIASGALDARFAYVFCNREPGEDPATDSFFELVRHTTDAPLLTLSSVRFRKEHGGERSRPDEALPAWRAEYDAAVARLLASHEADVHVLAGYMLILTPGFVEGRTILNLHPALPGGPIGTWREVIRDLIRSRATESGVMVHLAIPDVDAGPVAAYCRYAIRGGNLDPLWDEVEPRIDDLDDDAIEATELFQRIRDRGVEREAPFLVATLAAFASGRLRADGARLLHAHGNEAASLDLTEEVEQRLA